MNPMEPSIDRRDANGDADDINRRSFGDSVRKKKEKTIRVMFQNVRGIGYGKKHFKAERVRQTIVNHKVDVMMIAEVNVNWERAGRENSFRQIARYWFRQCKSSCTYNQHQRLEVTKWQPGGHAIVSRDEISLRIINYDQDIRRMGRWTSQLIQGKMGIKTRVVSVYVPRTSKDHTHQRIYCQQQAALLKLKVTGAVLTVFWEDFWEQIDKWRAQGDQLVIGGDWNEDIREEEFLKPFLERRLVPTNFVRHGPDLPATHNAGKLPIDEIFVSETLEYKKCGYLEHGHSSGDHRALWVDITYTSALGDKLPTLTTFEARKLKCHDPRIVERYNTLLKVLLMHENFMQRLIIIITH